MTTLVNSFEGGTNGTTITTGNAGGSTGYGAGPQFTNNQFDTVLIAGTGAIAFDNTQAAHGTLAAKATSSASGDKGAVEWVGTLGTQTFVWFREYLYFTANPSAVSARVFTEFSSATAAALVNVNTSGKLLMQDSTSTQMFIFAGAIPLNQWFRIEGWISNSATVGQAYLALYSSMDSYGPTEVHTSTATFNTLASINTAVFGIGLSTGAVGPYWFDDIGVSTTGALGPAFFPSAPVSGLMPGATPSPPGFLAPGTAPDVPPPPPQAVNDIPPTTPVPYLIGQDQSNATAIVTCTTTVPTGAGDTIIVAAEAGNIANAPLSCTDSAGNAYVQVNLQNSNIRFAQWVAPNPAPLPAGSTITATFTNTSGRKLISACGVPASSITAGAFYSVNNQARAGTNNSNASTAIAATPAGIPVPSRQMVVVMAVSQFSVGGPQLPLNWNIISTQLDAGNAQYMITAWRLLPATIASGGTVVSTFTGSTAFAVLSYVTLIVESRFAATPGMSLNPRPDMPPGMNSPGAWQYLPGFGEPGSFPYNPGPNRWTEKLAAASVTHPAIIRQTGKQIPATPHPSGKLVRSTGKTIAAIPHPAGQVTRAAGKTLPAAPHPAGKLVKSPGKILPATPHPAGKLIRRTGKQVPATPHPAGRLVRAVSKTLPATAHAAGGARRAFVRTLHATVTVTGHLTVSRVIKALFRAGYARLPWTAGPARNAPSLRAAPGLATDPGDWAVPGEMWPGSVWPADVPPPAPVLFEAGAARLPWTAGRARPRVLERGYPGADPVDARHVHPVHPAAGHRDQPRQRVRPERGCRADGVRPRRLLRAAAQPLLVERRHVGSRLRPHVLGVMPGRARQRRGCPHCGGVRHRGESDRQPCRPGPVGLVDPDHIIESAARRRRKERELEGRLFLSPDPPAPGLPTAACDGRAACPPRSFRTFPRPR